MFEYPSELKKKKISGHSERISPGVIRSEVGRPVVSHSPSGHPSSERITPGEILSEWPEITTPVWFWPKFLENHTPVNPQKFSRGLVYKCPFRDNFKGIFLSEYSDYEMIKGGYKGTTSTHSKVLIRLSCP